MSTRRALLLLGALGALALAGPWLAPYDPGTAHRGYVHAPPMWPQARDGFVIHPVVLEDRLQQRFSVDRSRTLPLPWASPEEPVFLLGADRSGRDVLSRLLAGAQVSLGLALLAIVGAAAFGTVLGSIAGARGGLVDDLVMRLADFVIVLPVLYVIVVLRAALPLVVPAATVFALTLGIFVLVGWPVVARGVRMLVSAERTQEYVLAARAAGGSDAHVLWRHLLPACAGHLAVQATLLLPGYILAEATLSYLGLGFADTVPTWGTMLSDAADINELSQFPWTLSSALAIFLVTLATNVVLQQRHQEPGTSGWR
jgi:peptide/nickel transport system permease protein